MLIMSCIFFCLLFFLSHIFFFFFFFNDTATTEIYTLSLHDALPIFSCWCRRRGGLPWHSCTRRSEEHTSELQSRRDLVCRLLLEKKKKKKKKNLNKKKKKKQKSTKKILKFK